MFVLYQPIWACLESMRAGGGSNCCCCSCQDLCDQRDEKKSLRSLLRLVVQICEKRNKKRISLISELTGGDDIAIPSQTEGSALDDNKWQKMRNTIS